MYTFDFYIKMNASHNICTRAVNICGQALSYIWSALFQGEFCSQGVREGLVVSFIKFICQSSRQYCESAGDRGGSTPPALLLLLSRLCLDYETSTISYILTLTDEQFLVQVSIIFSITNLTQIS